MSFLASLALTAFCAFHPQNDPAAPGASAQGPAPLLTPAEQTSLRDKIVKYLDAKENYEFAETIRERERTAKKNEQAKEAFLKEWELRSKKGNLLGSMADLKVIYYNCFAIDPPKVSGGSLRKEKLKEEGLDYAVYWPKAYSEKKPMRTVLVLPGTQTADANSPWIDAEHWFEATWDKTPLLSDTIVHIAGIPNSPSPLEMDPVPDFSRQGQDVQEDRRIEAVFAGFGTMMKGMNVDRAQLFLDCARGDCGFGIRLVSMFPDRFAGIVLRHPTEIDGIRFGSLSGIHVLMLKTAATAAAVDALKAKLEAVTPGSVQVIDATDEYPHKAAAGAIADWMGKQQRNMTPTHVLIEPNHDRYKKAYWVAIGPMNPLHSSSDETKARIEVDADRAANRIVVKARGIEAFTLYLNDALVDLDKEFTVIVNDKAVTEKRTRDAAGLEKRLVERRDWDFLFPVVFDSTVPKPSPEKSDKAEASGGK